MVQDFVEKMKIGIHSFEYGSSRLELAKNSRVMGRGDLTVNQVTDFVLKLQYVF